MMCVKFTTFCDLQADLRIRLATLRKFWFCKLALTCVDLRVRLARALDLKRGAHKQCMQQRSNILTVSYLLVKRVCHLTGVGELTEATETN